MKRVLVQILLALWGSHAVALDDATTKKFSQDDCNRSAVEVDVSRSLYEVGLSSSVMVQLLLGHTQEATEQLGSELAIKVVTLNEQLKNNPCKVSQKMLKRIYPILRVVAAANHKTPIPKINDDKEVLAIFDQAVADNPTHYQQLIERSSQWDHGIQ